MIVLPAPGDAITKPIPTPCSYCGREAISVVDCPVPSRVELLTDPALAQHCVIAPRFRWCCWTFYFAAWYGDGDAPGTEIPGTPFLLLPR